MVSLNAEESKKTTLSSGYIYQLNASLGFVNGGAAGIGKFITKNSKSYEKTINFHYDECKYFYNVGAYFQINNFRNPERKGFFWLLKTGLGYTEGDEFFNLEVGEATDNDDDEDYHGIFPYAAVGIGYGIPISRSSHCRIYWDIGLKKSVTNINISFLF